LRAVDDVVEFLSAHTNTITTAVEIAQAEITTISANGDTMPATSLLNP